MADVCYLLARKGETPDEEILRRIVNKASKRLTGMEVVFASPEAAIAAQVAFAAAEGMDDTLPPYDIIRVTAEVVPQQ